MIAQLGKVGGQAKGPQGQPAEVPPNQLQEGEAGGNAQFALQALNSLQKYLAAETEPEVIAIIRSVILILNGLVAKDNGKQMEQLPQDVQMMGQGQEQQPQGGPGMMGGGSPMPMGMGQ
jgi:hypothetical protein